MKKLIISLVVLCCSSIAFAQTPPPAQTPAYKLVLASALPIGEKFVFIASDGIGGLYLVTDKNVYQLVKI